jgi:hypothetical protein
MHHHIHASPCFLFLTTFHWLFAWNMILYSCVFSYLVWIIIEQRSIWWWDYWLKTWNYYGKESKRTIVIRNNRSIWDVYLSSIHNFWLMVSLLDGVVKEFWHVRYVLKILIISGLCLVKRSLTLIAIGAFCMRTTRLGSRETLLFALRGRIQGFIFSL